MSAIAVYGLLATNTISSYPKELLVPSLSATSQIFMASPNAGQTLETTITGTTQQMGLLQYQYPYYGRVQVSGLPLGRSSYHAMTTRVERRFSQGLSMLANYTFGQLKDDVGGADGQGGKTVQSFDSFKPRGASARWIASIASTCRGFMSSRSAGGASGWAHLRAWRRELWTKLSAAGRLPATTSSTLARRLR